MRTTHIDQVDLNLLPALVALLEEQHVSRAADRVRLSQPAMSRALQRLRRHFGDELLVRGPDGYSLTPRAARLRGQLTTAVSHLEQLFAAEAFDPATAAQSFRLAVSDYTVATFGPALVRTVLAASPNSTVSCEVLDGHAFDKLDAGTVDLAIYGRVAPERYCSQLLFTDRFVCVVATDHPLADQASVSLSTYLRWPHLTVDIGQPWIDRALEPLGIARRVAVSMPYFALAPSILPGTDLLLTVPERVARKNADPARTSILAAPRELTDLEFYAVWHPRFDQDPAHSWLREMVRTASESTA